MKAVTATTISQNAAETEVKGKAEKKAGKRIGYNYIIIKSLKESQKNDVVKCLYIKSLTDFRFCVIKEGTYGDSKDKQGRDIKDRLMWQKQLHEALQDKVRLPRLMGHFEENGNYYLVMENIKGKPLYKAVREKNGELRDGLINGTKVGITFVDYLLQIVELLDTLHQNNVVHRDATANNFIITPGGKVAVIDMELSYSLQQQAPAPPFQLGTYGYMSPEQLKTLTPTVKEDVFAAGAVLLQVWTGISPTKLTDNAIDELQEKVQFFVQDRAIADIIVKCLHPDPLERPSLKVVYEVLAKYKSDLRGRKQRPVSKQTTYEKEEIRNTIQQAIESLCSPLMADADKGWFSEETRSELLKDKNKINKAWYTSFHRGGTGVIYLMNEARRAGYDVSRAALHIPKVLDLIESKYINRINQVSPGLHFGASGIAACVSSAIRDQLIEPQTRYFEWINLLLKGDYEGLGVTHGVAGQGMAHMLCSDYLHPNHMKPRLEQYVQHLLDTQQKDGSWIYQVNQKTKKEKKRQGFATGAAGIVYFLLVYAQEFGDGTAMAAAQCGLKWLMKKSVHKGNAIHWRTNTNKELMHWWSEGTSGIAVAFLKAYSITGQPVYKQYATGALLNQPAHLLDSNLSQFEGLSGLGEVYLEAYSVLRDQQWLERSDWIIQALMNLRKSHKDYGPYWLVDHERQPTSDFMIGNSGIVHFLLRYCHKDEIRFPLLP